MYMTTNYDPEYDDGTADDYIQLYRNPPLYLPYKTVIIEVIEEGVQFFRG